MKIEEFKKVRGELNSICEEIQYHKGLAYSGKEDKLGNFKRIARLLNTTPESVLFVYLMKHIDAIASYVRGEYCDSEKIEGRIADVRNYMDLLYGLVKEKEK